MAQLIVVGFKGDTFRAGEVLNKLKEMNDSWIVDLKDAVAIYRDPNGKLRVDESYQRTGAQGAGAGAFWGTLIGLIAAIPLTAFALGASSAALAGAVAAGTLTDAAVGATAGGLDAKRWKRKFGIPESFEKTVADMLQPCDSAIIALLHTVNPEKVAEEFRGYGGTVLQTTLTREQAARVQAVLDGGDSRAPEKD